MGQHVLPQDSLSTSCIQALDRSKVTILGMFIIHFKLDSISAAVFPVFTNDQEPIDHVPDDREYWFQLGNAESLAAVWAIVAVGEPCLDADLAEDMTAGTLQGIIQDTLTDAADEILIWRILKAIHIILSHLGKQLVRLGSHQMNLCLPGSNTKEYDLINLILYNIYKAPFQQSA